MFKIDSQKKHDKKTFFGLLIIHEKITLDECFKKNCRHFQLFFKSVTFFLLKIFMF